MREKIKAVFNFAAKNYFFVTGLIALLIPDFLLRYGLGISFFESPFSSRVPALFSLFWVLLILYISAVFLPKKVGIGIFIAVTVLINALSFSSYIYYKIFDQFFWLSSIGLVGEAGDYVGYALSHIDSRVITLTLLSLIFAAATIIGWDKKSAKGIIPKLLVIIPLTGLVSTHLYMVPSLHGEADNDWDSWNKPRIVYSKFSDANKSMSTAGLYQYVAKDLFRTVFPSNTFSKEDYAEAESFFRENKASANNSMTGLLKGKNVIAVMMEGMDDWMISQKYTPTLKYMIDNGISFTKHFAPTFGTGATFNTEFAFNTGYYTPQSATTAVNFGKNSFPYALPNLFKDNGYSVNSFHYNSPEFYNRGIMHKSFGYEAYNSFMDYGMTDYAAQADSNIIGNDDIYKKMTEGDKFFDFVITYSGHVPYTFDDAKLSLAKKNHPSLIDTSMDKETNNLLILARDTDDFFRQLLERLEEDNLLENTVIMAFSDHYAYGFSNTELLTKYTLDAGCGLFQLVPAFIYTPNIEPVKVDKVTQTIDLVPTLINLMGFEKPDAYIGRDAFDEGYKGFTYFENASWFDGTLYYVPGQTEIPKGEEDRVKNASLLTKNLIRINDIVVSGDYFAKR